MLPAGYEKENQELLDSMKELEENRISLEFIKQAKERQYTPPMHRFVNARKEIARLGRKIEDDKLKDSLIKKVEVTPLTEKIDATPIPQPIFLGVDGKPLDPNAPKTFTPFTNETKPGPADPFKGKARTLDDTPPPFPTPKNDDELKANINTKELTLENLSKIFSDISDENPTQPEIPQEPAPKPKLTIPTLTIPTPKPKPEIGPNDFQK
jgi:hypothetical protein